MKKIVFISLMALMAVVAGCDENLPMDENLYPQSVYLVGSRNLIVDRDLNIGDLQDTIYASVAISGSLPTDTDVTVSLEELPSAIDAYNKRERGSDDILYRNLANDIYSFPQENLIIQKGSVYNTYPVYVKPATLHIDSLYMISLKLKSTSAYTLAKSDTVALIRVNLMNDYSGQYYMDGIIKSLDNPTDSVIYKSSRKLQAVKNGNTVRMYHQKNEWTKGSTDYRPNFCFNITVNGDKSVSLEPWQNFRLLDGGGKYYPELEVYDLWYTFIEDGENKKTRGFVYKERKNDDDQRIINDWMEENRSYD